MKCPECGNEIVIEKIPYLYQNQIYLGEFEAERCFKCNTDYFTEKAYKEIEKVAKTMKIWGYKRVSGVEEIITVKGDDIPVVNLMTLYGDITVTRKMTTVSV
jgi:hypothetical protein